MKKCIKCETLILTKSKNNTCNVSLGYFKFKKINLEDVMKYASVSPFATNEE